MSENDAEFIAIMMQDGDWQPGSRMHRLALLARRGADAANRIEQLEAEVKVWQGHAKTAIWSDSEECKFLTARIAQLEAALRPFACTCEARHQADCSRSEVDCPFWNARAALEASDE